MGFRKVKFSVSNLYHSGTTVCWDRKEIPYLIRFKKTAKLNECDTPISLAALRDLLSGQDYVAVESRRLGPDIVLAGSVRKEINQRLLL